MTTNTVLKIHKPWLCRYSSVSYHEYIEPGEKDMGNVPGWEGVVNIK